MVSKNLSVRFLEELVDKIEADCVKKGISKTQWLKDSTNHFLTCPKAERIQALKLIPLKFPDNCRICHKSLPMGDWAWWGRGTGVICPDCEVQKYGDKTTIKKLIRLKEMKWQDKALKRQIEEQVDKTMDLMASDKFNIVYDKITEATETALKYLTAKIGRPEEKDAFEEFLRVLEDAKKVIADIESALERQGYRIKKKKKITYAS